MPDAIHRRDCLRLGAGMLAGTLLSTKVRPLSAAEPAEKRARIGFVGLGPRGSWLLQCLVNYVPNVTIPAVCDLVPERVQKAIDTVTQTGQPAPVGYCKGEYEYRSMFERDDLDAILIATGVQKEARIAVDAMKAGKDVATEVTGAYTLEDCWNLVETKERTGKRLMLLEQCCYDDLNLAILGMVRRGVFGEPYYAECSYVHDLKNDKDNSYFVQPDGTPTWRGQLLSDGYGSSYGPHGLTSVAKWMDINEGDRFESCTAVMSDPRELHAQLVAHYGADSPAAQLKIKTGDFHTTLIRTAKGRMIRLDYSLTATRPYSRYYLLQGMEGCLDTRVGCYLRGQGPMHEWQPVETFVDKYRHPWWALEGEEADKVGGHGGMDFFCLREFVRMIVEGFQPWVDVYDTAAYNAINHCSQVSIDRKGAAVEIPDFTHGRWKTPGWRSGPQDPMTGIAL